DPAQGSLSSVQEKRLGEIIMREMRQEPDYLHDSLLRDYLQAIVDRLTPAARRTAEMEAPAHFRVFLLRDRSFNAFALPGGWIGVHTGLIIDAQSHDQVAAVFAHEMSHITQRHIAQRLAQMGRDRLLSIGSLLLAVAAASAGQDQAAQGLAMGGQAAAIDRALRFSRSNERDADRTGEEVLAESGYPQNLSRLDDSDVLAFLQTHPLTSERIADAQARGGNHPLPPDHDLMFWLMHARARALTPTKRDAMQREEKRFSADKAAFPAQQAAIAYGQAVLLQRLGRFDAAAAALTRAQAAVASAPAAERLPLDLLQAELLLEHQPAQAADAARALYRQFPQSTAARHLLARCLLALPDKKSAREFLRQQTVAHPQD
ncbi:MAG: peptidase M48 Ste24p, partial [Thiomonas sp. 15-63-373]